MDGEIFRGRVTTRHSVIRPRPDSLMTGVTVSSLEYNVFCIPQKQIFPVLWIPSTALKDAYHHTIHAYTAGVAVAQRKKLILRMRVGRLLTAARVHVVSFAARGVKAMR